MDYGWIFGGIVYILNQFTYIYHSGENRYSILHVTCLTIHGSLSYIKKIKFNESLSINFLSLIMNTIDTIYKGNLLKGKYQPLG